MENAQIQRLIKIRRQQANELWSQLRNVPVNNDGDTEEEFLHFSVGTDTHDIWHYFEEEFNISVAEDLMKLTPASS
jgi:hypothetical protein